MVWRGIGIVVFVGVYSRDFWGDKLYFLGVWVIWGFWDWDEIV